MQSMSPPVVNIRQFQASDAEAVVRLWQACGLTRPWNDPYRDIARKLTVQPELFLVGTVSNNVVASIMAGYDGHRGWVNYLAVAPALQRQGCATRLMREAEQRLTAMGCPKINLLVRRGNEPVAAFYRKLGYETDEVISLGKRLIADS